MNYDSNHDMNIDTKHEQMQKNSENINDDKKLLRIIALRNSKN